jgi:ammonium transporter Rh
LDGIERYIDALSKHILKIQEEEVYITNKFTDKLQGLKGPSDKAAKHEDRARIEYQKDLDTIRNKRRQYREMLYDAMLERRKLMESMQIQKDEDDVLRKKLVKLGVLSPVEQAYEHLKSASLDPFGIVFIFLQIALIIIYGIAVTYDDAPARDPLTGAYVEGLDNRVGYYYQHYTDIAFMVFIGLGFLMTFLRKYAYSAVGFAFFTACFVFQWALLVSAFFDRAYTGVWDRVSISMVYLIQGMYGATACLVTFGVVLGNVSPLQILILVLLEVPIYGVNKYICLQLLGGLDFGGSMVIHMFGAYFGLGASYAISPSSFSKSANAKKRNAEHGYTNDMFALIGTLFLWVLWPSFNSALAGETFRYRIISNTILALCTSAVLGFITSRLLRGGKFEMIDIQNATIAGGIATGAAAMMLSPAGALITGAVAGAVCVATVVFLQPWLRHWFLDDTRNAHCVHGISGFIGGVTSIICAAIAIHNADLYGQDPLAIFPRGSKQASIQLAILFITLGIALLPGVICGFFVRFITKYKVVFSDENEWSVPKDFEPNIIEDQVPVSAIIAKH